MIYHIEVHSRDRQIEHYIVPHAANEADATQSIRQFYADKGQRIGLWEKESDRNDLRIPYLIFRVNELPGDPVIYIAGEYRSQFPI
jgi:hypothetical protein